MHAIKVEPLGDGWSVSLDEAPGAQVFHSGRLAERAARSMGERLAAAGAHVEICIYLRDGTRASRFVCAPAGV